LISGAARAAVVTVAVESPLVTALYPGQRARMGLACALATSATNLLMNSALRPRLRSFAAYLIIGELGALVVEAAVYFAIDRHHQPRRAALASTLANLASFLLGPFLLRAVAAGW
jgi:hypothetical protein